MTTTSPYLKKVKNKELVDPDTGEMVKESFSYETTDLMVLESDDYYVVSRKAMRVLEQKMNMPDFGRAMRLNTLIENDRFNILYYKGQPMTHTGLNDVFLMARSKYHVFMKKCYDLGIIAILSLKRKGIEYKYIVLNPNLARRGRMMSTDTMELFDPLEEFIEKLNNNEASIS